MFKNLRIACAVIAAACAAAAVFVFVYAGVPWGFICVFGAVVFFLLTLLFKRKQEEKEVKDNPPPPEGDFITGACRMTALTKATATKTATKTATATLRTSEPKGRNGLCSSFELPLQCIPSRTRAHYLYII